MCFKWWTNWRKWRKKYVWNCSVTLTAAASKQSLWHFNSNWQWLNSYACRISQFISQSHTSFTWHACYMARQKTLFSFFHFLCECAYFIRLLFMSMTVSLSLFITVLFFFFLRFNSLYQSIQDEIITIAKKNPFLSLKKKIFILFSLITFESSKQHSSNKRILLLLLLLFRY